MSVKVAVRVRPFNERQKFLGCLNCIQMKDKTTILVNPRDRSQKQHQFSFDYSLWSHQGYEVLQNGYFYPVDDRYIDQKRIFKELGQDIIDNAWKGYNCCLFAYGQTGAGKSYSIIGYGENRGILPMACEKMFAGIQKNRIKGQKQFQVHISMLEIYNEKVQDLFVNTNKRPPNGLRIRQNRTIGVYVEGITKFQVYSYKEIQKKMEIGSRNRSLAATLMNQYSSRAHTIVMLEFIQKQFITNLKMNKRTSLLNLVDLAGSERVSKTGIANNKDRLKEASQINKSLHTLGRVIESLADIAIGKKNIQTPYRESALTRILETALGGNSVTTMICAISPANDNYEQTLSTLRYADQTKRIKNKPIINESAVDKIIRELRQENDKLKDMLRIAKLKGINFQQTNIQANIQQIQRQIRKNMQSFALNTQEEDEDENLLMMSEFIDLPEPSEFDEDLSYKAYITNLNEDQQLNFKIRYSCDDELYVGNKNLVQPNKEKLILCGLGIEEKHARIVHQKGRYFIQPMTQSASQYTYVNGKTVSRIIQIYHNDRVIFGTNSIFLFQTQEKLSRKNVRISEKMLDYEFAINERNNEMLQTSQYSSTSTVKGDQYALAKLQQIEYEFQELKKDNERKMKEKEEKFKEQLKKIELQRQIEKQKLQNQLKEKQSQAGKIIKEKERVERIRDKLLKRQEQRKQREKKLRQTMLLDMDEDGSPQNTQTQPKEVQIQYIDRHHYHYDYNVVHVQSTKQQKDQQTFANTTTQAMDESLLIGDKGEEMKVQKQTENLALVQNVQKKKKNFGIQKTLEISESGFKKQKNVIPTTMQEKKEVGLNVSQIMYEDKRKLSAHSQSSEEENLLNSTLEQYIPKPPNPQRKSSSYSKKSDLSFNLSQISDEADKTNLKEVELTNRIKQLEQKLVQLQKSEKLVQQSQQQIKQEKIRKSFGDRPNSENFTNMDSSLNISEIAARSDESSFEKNLKKNLVQCKNENILNERTIQIRKRKRQGQELKKILMKKYKGQINKKLVILIPMVEKFNLWARQMSRNTQCRIFIEYHNFTNYEVVEALKNSSYKNKINIQIKVLNYEEGRHYRWPVEVFENRYELVQNLFQKYIQNPSSQLFAHSDKEKDPFWQPLQYQPYAYAYLSLQCLLYGLQFDGDVCCVHKGKIVGYLNIRVSPIKQKTQDKKKISEFYSGQEMINPTEQILDPRYLLEKDIFFTIEINSFKPTQDFSTTEIIKYMISYEMVEGAYKTQKFQTSERNVGTQEIMYMYKHRFKDISENILGYLADSPVVMTVNVIYDIDENLANMTSSFLQVSKSDESFQNTSMFGSSTVKSVSELTPPTFSKQKSGKVFENEDVMGKINSDMKKYNSEKKEAEVVRPETKKKKKHSREEKDCVIY